jgi:hypothetical protein
MIIAILIIVIVSLIILALLSFFIFQIWVQHKELKIQLSNHMTEIKNGFINFESSQKALNIQTLEILKLDYNSVLNAIEQMKEEIKKLEINVNENSKEIINQNSKDVKNSEVKTEEFLDSFKIKNNTIIESLSDNIKLFKENIESRFKDLEYSVSQKLIGDLTHLVNNYSEDLKEIQQDIFDNFELKAKSINDKQVEILNAILEPLNIKQNFND